MDWEQYKKDHCSEFDKLLAELHKQRPDEMEEARLWVKENLNKEIPKTPLMRVGAAGGAGTPCPLCGSGMKPNWLFFKSKGCFQPECENYWRSK